MTTIRHPVTGALMNDIQHIATGPITEAEIRAARSDDRQPDMFDILFGDDGDQLVTPAPS